MTKNMGSADKMIRLIAAAVILILNFTGVIQGTLAVVLLIVAAVFVLTSLISFCPLYPLLGINTKGKGKSANE